jgi:hypothetical protein
MSEVVDYEVREPKNKTEARKYQLFEEYFDGTINLNNYPDIIGNQIKYLRHFLRYCFKQQYNMDAAKNRIRDDPYFTTDEITKAIGSKLDVKAFPPYSDYVSYFGLPPSSAPHIDEDDDTYDYVVEIGDKLVNDEINDIKYIPRIREYVYWTGNYWEIDIDGLELELRITDILKEMNMKVRTNVINEIKNHIKRHAKSDYQEWNTRRDLLVFKNGIWMIQLQTFLPPDKTILDYRVIDGEYYIVKEIPAVHRKFLDNLEWHPQDHIRWLTCMKATIEHTGFDNKKCMVHFGVPNAGKSIITTIFESMLGPRLVDVISYDRLLQPFTFGDCERTLAMIIDDIETSKGTIYNKEYGKIKEITSGKPFSVEKKGVQRRKIFPVFTTHQTMNDLYKFPTNVMIDAVGKRFILFKYFKSQKPDYEFEEKLKEAGPDFRNYLLTATLPSITEIPSIPITNSDSFDLDDPNLVLNYWDAETQRYNEFIENMISYKKDCFTTLPELVNAVYDNCKKGSFRIDKFHFQSKILPALILSKGGKIFTTKKKNGTIIEWCGNIQCQGAEFFKSVAKDTEHRDIEKELENQIKLVEQKKEIDSQNAIKEAEEFEMRYPED